MSTNYTLSPVTLSDHLLEETQGSLSPVQADPIATAEQTIDHHWWAKIMSMTALRFKELSAAERRLYAMRARQLAKVLGEKACMFTRNSGAEVEVPAYLRASGGGV